jgi:hypothetical protein
MRNVNLSKLSIFSPRLDWLSVLGSIPHIDRERDLEFIETFFKEAGFEKVKNRKRPVFRSNVYGIEISFGRQKKTGGTFLKIEFQGQFFADSMDNSEIKINNVINTLWKQFGVSSPPNTTRVDIAIDILDVSHKTIFPDLSKKQYQILTNCKFPPKLKHAKYYNDGYDKEKETGISVYNSRYEFALYERLTKLEEYAKVPHKLWYVEYYKKLYDEAVNDVLRFEVRLKKKLCDYFTHAFFIAKDPINDVIRQSLAHFNHNHRIYFINSKKVMKPIKHIDQLFFRDDYQSIKQLRDDHNVETDLRGLHFPKNTTDLNPATTQIANALIVLGRTNPSDIEEINKNIEKKIIQNAEEIEKEIINQRKTENLFNFNREKQKEYEENYLETMHELRLMQSDPNSKVKIINEKLKTK